MRLRAERRMRQSPCDGPAEPWSLGVDPKSTPARLLAGWLLSATALSLRGPSPLPPRIGAVTPARELLERGSVRELSVISGLGARRAQALVSSRAIDGGLPPLEEIPGIGPKTAESLRLFSSGGLSLSGRPRRQGLPAAYGLERAAQPARAEALELGEELSRDPRERPPRGRARVIEEERCPAIH